MASQTVDASDRARESQVPMTNRQPPVQHPDESVGIEVVRSSESQQVVATLSAGSTCRGCGAQFQADDKVLVYPGLGGEERPPIHSECLRSRQ
jgi:hypothetical protein